MGSDAGEFRFFLNEEAKQAGIVFKNPRPDDAGFDLPALESVTIPGNSLLLVRTGLHLAIPLGWVGLIRDRSSIASRGLMTLAGVIDASYRGEVKILFHNTSANPQSFSPGDRIAQLVVVQHLPGSVLHEVNTVQDLGSSERGEGGFGSTGR